MNSRNWVRLFLSTLLLGSVSTIVTSFFVKHEDYVNFLQPFNLFELFGLLVFFTALGCVFSLISQMGFFAYLTVNQFGLGVFKGLWGLIQVALILFAIFDLVYFRFRAADGENALFGYILAAFGVLVLGLIVAYIKAKETNFKAFLPALFFMVVVTSVEWVPGLRSEGSDYTWLMIVPLLTCNAYQLLLLHRINNKQKEKAGQSGKSINTKGKRT